MAFRTGDYSDLSLFGNRLLSLRLENQLDTAKKIAEKIYEKKLIIVNQKKSFEEEWKTKDNAISSIARTIQRHLNMESPDNVRADYIIAYSKLFNCSTDYLLIRTNVKSLDLSIQSSCRALNLSEQSIKNIMYRPTFNHKYRRSSETIKAIDLLLSSSEFNDFIEVYDDWIADWRNFTKACNDIESELKNTVGSNRMEEALKNYEFCDGLTPNDDEIVTEQMKSDYKAYSKAIDRQYLVHEEIEKMLSVRKYMANVAITKFIEKSIYKKDKSRE